MQTSVSPDQNVRSTQPRTPTSTNKKNANRITSTTFYILQAVLSAVERSTFHRKASWEDQVDQKHDSDRVDCHKQNAQQPLTSPAPPERESPSIRVLSVSWCLQFLTQQCAQVAWSWDFANPHSKVNNGDGHLRSSWYGEKSEWFARKQFVFIGHYWRILSHGFISYTGKPGMGYWVCVQCVCVKVSKVPGGVWHCNL